jgi:hypothetical protein
VQRILKEHGIKSVQALIDGSSAAPSFGAANEAALREALEEGDAPETDAVEDEDDEIAEPPAVMARRAPEFSAPSSRVEGAARPAPASAARPESGGGRRIDTARLETALQDLIACRQLLDTALKEG